MSKIRLTLFLGSFSVGGGQQVVYELIRKLDQSRFDVSVICYEGKANTKVEAEIETLCSVIYLDAKGKVTFSKIRRVFAALKMSKPDVVHVHLGAMVYAVPWAILNKTPLLITAHTKPAQAFVPSVLPLIRWGLQKGKTQIVAVSKENDLMMQEFFGINDDRLSFVNNGIELDRFYWEEHSTFTYINVARQDENKNQVQIIRCFADVHKRYSDTKLLLVGDGPCNFELKQLVMELGLQDAIEMPGMRSDVEIYYAKSDVYIQASHREALPMSALEAMAAGLPIISTNVGGMKDIVTLNGILVPDGDENGMTAAMIALLEMPPKEREEMRNHGRKAVAEYSSDNMARKYMSIYQNMRI